VINPARNTMASLPRILSSSSVDRPHILLPVPDPSSFRFLAHWCYFKDLRYIRDYLARGLLSWEGVARNVEYLGLPPELRSSLAGLYHYHVSREWDVTEPTLSDGSDDECDHTASSEESSDDNMDMDEDEESLRGPAFTRKTARFSICPTSSAFALSA
jgi:hypothetical protein